MNVIAVNSRESPSRVRLTMPGDLAEKLFAHLFPGDGDEHGAVIGAGMAYSPDGQLRLLGREIVLARDGVEYIPGERGYRMLTGQFVTEQIVRCRNNRLVYLAVHNHGGTSRVGFSQDDLASHRRGYPALLDVMEGRPVGALVFAREAAAGQLWLSAQRQVEIDEVTVLGSSIVRLMSQPAATPAQRAPAYDRQARLFGDRGQDLLQNCQVAVIGAGGAGSLIVEYLARLGVGRFVVIDPERLDPTNVPRVTGSTNWDAMSWLRAPNRAKWLRTIGERLAAPKVRIMRRLIRRANPRAEVTALMSDFVDDAVARSVLTCDYLVLAADSMHARLVFNSIVHAYLIPGVQVGAKVPVDSASGDVGTVFTVSRPVTPSSGCLWCNGLITPAGLQREAETDAERRAQRYLAEAYVVAPSVVTLNATAASQAANDFLFAVTGLADRNAPLDYIRFIPRERSVKFERPRRDAACPHCGIGAGSLLGRGDAASLPTRERAGSGR